MWTGKVFPLMNENRKQKWIFHICAFISFMVLTFWSIFRNQDFMEMAATIQKLSMQSIAAAIFLGVSFVAGEGCIIWYLLKEIGEKTGLLRCLSYSFIGFFFSGVTPSATGGQPMQLYYMKKDGNKISSASVVLMTVAIIYKFVLVLMGIGIMLFWGKSLKKCLQGYYWLYFVGLFLNIIVVMVLFMVMFSRKIIRTVFYKMEKILIYFKFWKKSDLRKNKAEQFLSDYQETVCFLRNHKKMILFTVVGTFLQRLSVFLLTYVVYRGLGLNGASISDIILLQASVYIAVDMLPVPGAQGISEAMYRVVFENIFPGYYLVVSMCITRGISFYLVMVLSFAVWGIMHFQKNKKIEY